MTAVRFDPSEIQLIGFDLDNTLYDEGLYFGAALEVIGAHLASETGVAASVIEETSHRILRAKGRHYHHLFNDLLAELELTENGHLEELLRLFRGVEAPLAPFPGVRELLQDLRKRYRLGLITSGMRAVQENKLRLLGIAACFDEIIYSSTLPENKPGQLPFKRLLELLDVDARQGVYVGDNPLADFRGAKELGMWTVRVRNPEFDDLEVTSDCDADLKIESVCELRSLFLEVHGLDRDQWVGMKP